MKQILQHLNNGQVEIAEAPCPALRAGQVLIRTRVSLISAGTERMLLDFGKANFIDKARQQPDKVRMVLDKARTDGISAAYESVQAKLGQPIPLGYCNAGMVLDVGAGIGDLRPGDRVVSNGAHAEVVAVPRNLCAAIPAAVDDDAAAFTVIGAIALEGLRLAAPTLGECFAVSGLGLVGLMATELLRAQGCRVLGIDFDASKLALAREFGAETVNLGAGEDPVAAAHSFSRGQGMDGVLIAASTSSSEPVHQAATMCRKRGRIVLLGVTGLELSRDDFYKKELTFQVSCSYGPGRYDPAYEAKGQDYPLPFVRWTAQRNFEAVLDLMAEGRLDVAPLVSHRIPFDEAASAYELIEKPSASLGILLKYPGETERPEPEIRKRTVAVPKTAKAPSTPGTDGPAIALMGSGNFATRMLIPVFQKAGATIASVASTNPVTAVHAARSAHAPEVTSDNRHVFADSSVGAVVIATRHDTHAELVLEALRAGKHVFVEKPLALNHDQVASIAFAYTELAQNGKAPVVMVDFNRRFSPHVVKMRALVESIRQPKTVLITVNAGAIPSDHWTQDSAAGGGRIVGEACHFIDLMRFLVGSPVVGLHATRLGDHSAGSHPPDNAVITLTFADGSMGTIHYLAEGHRSFPKERIEVFAAGRVLALDNFRKLRGYGFKGFSKMSTWKQDKGHAGAAAAFVEACRRGTGCPIPFVELIEVAQLSLQAAEALSNPPVAEPAVQPVVEAASPELVAR